MLTESQERTQIQVPWTQRDLRVQPGNTLAWATLPGASGHAGVCGRGGLATPRPQPPLRKAPPPRVHEPPAALHPPLLIAPPLLLPEGPTPASRGRPALSGICRMRVHSPPKTSACQHHAKEPRKSGPGSEAVMPTQLWVRAPVPGPRMVCHPARGPGVGGSLPSAGRGARLESQDRGRAGGPLGTEPCPELCQLTAVPPPLKTHTHMADPLPENPALNAYGVSSAPRGWVRIRKGCKTRQPISLGPETQRPPWGWSQLGLSAPTPSPGHIEHRPGVPQTQAGGPHGGAREGIGQRGQGAPARKGDTTPCGASGVKGREQPPRPTATHALQS